MQNYKTKNRCFTLFAVLVLTSISALGADVTGKWQGTATGKGKPLVFNLKQDGSSLTGAVEGPAVSYEVKNGKVEGSNVHFEFDRDIQGKMVTLKYSGTVEGDTMKLVVADGREVTLKKQ